METRYQRIAREQAERQRKRAEIMKPKRAKRTPKPRAERNDDPLDNLDNLGESPDY